MTSSRLLPFVVLALGAGSCGGGGSAPKATGVDCGDAPSPWTSGAGAVTLTVDGAAPGAAWSRFYEGAVATDHANTILSSAWGRNAQNALKKGHDQAGFRYARFHGILNRDIAVYSEDASGNAVYDWTRFDMVYDAIKDAGMRPIVEISFMPDALASDASKIQAQLWYGGVSPNISPPRDWARWQMFMAEIVHHLEDRYGADEVRANWYFEVWNEATWMYSKGAAGYNELYYNTALGLLAGDPQIKVGGPADSGGNSLNAIPSLIDFVKAHADIKLDFISYHRYGQDSGTIAHAGDFVSWKNTLFSMVAAKGFTGEMINDEWGSSYNPELSRDTEASASFIAKSIHFLGTDATTPAPTMYGYWTMSDIYEEMNTGTSTAYREGNYGLLLKGDVNIPASFDLAKPAFNAFRMLHMMTDTIVPVTGGIASANDNGVGAVATLAGDGGSLQILVYNHVNSFANDTWEAMSQEPTLVTVKVQNLPFAPKAVQHYLVDHTHSNSHTVWAAMGKPPMPNADQWSTLAAASELCHYDSALSGGNSWTVTFPQNTYSVSLIQLSR